jgi:sulfur carrier protein
MNSPSTPITVYVNGDPRTVPAGTGLAELVDAHTPSRSGVAVAVDGEVVPRTGWAARRLDEGARVEILTAVQGG